MARKVKEWVGKDDDQPVPPRVRIRVFQAKEGRCHKCTREISAIGESWTCEHLIAIINGGENREGNLGLTCSICLPAKNAADVAEKAQVAKVRLKHYGQKPKSSRPMPGSKASGWKIPMRGKPFRRNQQ